MDAAFGRVEGCPPHCPQDHGVSAVQSAEHWSGHAAMAVMLCLGHLGCRENEGKAYLKILAKHYHFHLRGMSVLGKQVVWKTLRVTKSSDGPWPLQPAHASVMQKSAAL